MPPDEQSITSTPLALSRRASRTLWSGSQPASSSQERRMNSGFSAGQAARTHSATSTAKRMRLSSEPP